MTELATRKSTAISLPPKTRMTSTGLLMAGITKEEHAELGCLLARSKDATQWWQGDWLLAADPAYGEHQELCRQAGLNYETVRKYARVCAAIENGRRRPFLRFGHHAEVAVLTLEAEEQDAFLDEAEKHNWSVHKLRDHVQANLQLSDGPVDDNSGSSAETCPAPDKFDPPDDPVPPAAGNGTLEAVMAAASGFDAVLGVLSSLKTKITTLANGPAGELLAGELESIDRHRKDIYRFVRFCRPYAECIYCGGSGAKKGRVCRGCKGRGWLNETAITNAPPKETQT